MAMFSSQMTSTPFSVRDILNLEQNHEDLVSLDMSQRLDSALIPTSSCMLSTFKQEQFMEMPSGASLFSEDPQDDKGHKNSSLNFGAAAFYGKSFLEMDFVKDAKSDDTFEDKEKKGERSQESDIYCMGTKDAFHDYLKTTQLIILRLFLKKKNKCTCLDWL